MEVLAREANFRRHPSWFAEGNRGAMDEDFLLVLREAGEFRQVGCNSAGGLKFGRWAEIRQGGLKFGRVG